MLVVVVAALAWHEVRGTEKSGTRPGEPKKTIAEARRWGSFKTPFAVDSLWNSRPVDPVLGTQVIPKSDYVPNVAEGSWSTGVFLASDSDPPAVVYAMAGQPGVWDPDSEQARDVTIPHWPEEVAPAVETDGHAEIVDLGMGVVHSFWQLKRVRGRWTAAQYAWSRIDGRGWGDPAHYYQGARATAVPSSAGLIRKHEIDDGDDLYRHALAISLTFNALSAKPTYVFPATAADNNAATTNSGTIPEGSLLMLPASFDAQKLSTPSLRKIAETLKVYGAYVVDRNEGTPYSIYVEIGSGFNLHRRGWNNPAADDLETIRLGLRTVESARQWIDGDGKVFTPERNLNRLSMRGPWRIESGNGKGGFDTWQQAVLFEPSDESTVLVNESGRGVYPIAWASPVPGSSYRIVSITTGGAKLRIRLRSANGGRVLFDSGALANGESASFAWPADAVLVTYAISGSAGRSSVRANLAAAPS